MKRKLYQALASAIDAYNTCIKHGNGYAADTWKETITTYQESNLPHGSGIDKGCKIDLDRSTGERIVIHTSYHHMNEGGYYDGWTDHTITIKPSLMFGFTLSVSGINRNDIKEYLHEVFSYAIEEETEESK